MEKGSKTLIGSLLVLTIILFTNSSSDSLGFKTAEKEWDKIQEYYADVPDVNFEMSYDELGRAYTLCREFTVSFYCNPNMISVGIVQTNIEWFTPYPLAAFYHEAGHVFHFVNKDAVIEYRKFRILITEEAKDHWYEVFADDFMICAGYGDTWAYPFSKTGVDKKQLQSDICRIVTPIMYKNHEKYIKNKLKWLEIYNGTGRIDSDEQAQLSNENKLFRKIYRFTDYTPEQILEYLVTGKIRSK